MIQETAAATARRIQKVRTYHRARESTSHPTAARPPPHSATTPITNIGSELRVQQLKAPQPSSQQQSAQQHSQQ